MTAHCGLVVFSAIATPGAVSASPPDVLERPGVADGLDADERLDVTVRIRGELVDADLGAFLVSSIAARWDTEAAVDASASAPAAAGRFLVDVFGLSGGQVSVSVLRGDRLLGERTVEVTDPVEARLALWLFVRSSIERGLRVETSPPSPPDPLPEPVVQRAAMEPLAMPPTPVPHIETGTPVESAMVSNFVAALASVWLETPDLPSFGVGGEVGVHREWVTLAVGAGYRVARAVGELDLHALGPSVRLAATSHRKNFAASLGALARADVELAWTSERHAWALGAELGPVGSARIPLGEGKVGLVLQLAVAWRLRRQRYRLDGREITEQPWATSLAMGADWR